MNIQTIVSTVGLFGIGGIIGSYFQYLFNQKRETELKIQQINENKYRSILIQMRVVLNPNKLNHYQIDDPIINTLIKTKEIENRAKNIIIETYYNAFLYSSDDVLVNIKKFLKNPSELNFTKTAVSMRKDLWKKGKTKINAKDFALKDSAL